MNDLEKTTEKSIYDQIREKAAQRQAERARLAAENQRFMETVRNNNQPGELRRLLNEKGEKK